MSEPVRPAPEIRLQVLDDSTPHSTFVEIFKVFGEAFGSDSPIWAHMYPPPRPPMDEMADAGAKQHKLDCSNPDIVYVVATATFPDGEEKVAGVAVWGKPGYRFKTLDGEKMSEEEKYAYQGYNLVFRNAWRGTLQDHRDKLMGSEPYWYLSVLAVHPDLQKFKVGSQLLDQGVAWAANDKRATLLESSPAGKRLYESRGFVKEDEFPVCAEYAGLADLRFPLYRKPAPA